MACKLGTQIDAAVLIIYPKSPDRNGLLEGELTVAIDHHAEQSVVQQR